MEHINRFSYTTDDYIVNTHLELKIWMKPGTTFNGCPPINEKGCHATPREDGQGGSAGLAPGGEGGVGMASQMMVPPIMYLSMISSIYNHW